MAIDEAGLRAWRSMLLAYNAAMRAIDAEFDRAGNIPLTWYDVLLELNAAPDRRLRMRELADRVVLSRTRVSRLVDEMSRTDLVTKTQDDADRRSVWASITDAGVQELRRTAPRYMCSIEAFFTTHLTEEEKKTVSEALERVHAAHVNGHPNKIGRPQR